MRLFWFFISIWLICFFLGKLTTGRPWPTPWPRPWPTPGFVPTRCTLKRTETFTPCFSPNTNQSKQLFRD